MDRSVSGLVGAKITSVGVFNAAPNEAGRYHSYQNIGDTNDCRRFRDVVFPVNTNG